MTESGSSISTGNTSVTADKIRIAAAAINTHKMYVKDRTRELQDKKKEILGSDLPPVAFSALWRMRSMGDAERLTVVKAVQDYKRHLNGNAFKALQAIDEKRLEASKDMRDAKKSAKELGINVAALNIVLRFERLDEVEREEMFNSLDVYGVALRYW